MKGIVNLVLNIDDVLTDGMVDVGWSAGKWIFPLNLVVFLLMKRKRICMDWGIDE